MTGAVINLLLVIPFLVLAFFLSRGKGAFLIAGYKYDARGRESEV